MSWHLDEFFDKKWRKKSTKAISHNKKEVKEQEEIVGQMRKKKKRMRKTSKRFTGFFVR